MWEKLEANLLGPAGPAADSPTPVHVEQERPMQRPGGSVWKASITPLA